jgi:hypothetical protein
LRRSANDIESAFNQADTSPAKAGGLMQVTPEAGKDTAKRFGVSYDWKRLVSDPVREPLPNLLQRMSPVLPFASFAALARIGLVEESVS